MGTIGPGAVGHRHPPRLTATAPTGPPHLSEGTSCRQQGPGLQKRPRREVPGFPLRELVERKPVVEEFRLHICNSWMSQK